MTHRRPFVALAALLALPACATFANNPREHSALLSDAPRVLDRACKVSLEPRALPPADLLVDSAALSAAAARLWREAGSPQGHVLFAMRYDPEGLNVRRDILEHRLPPALADTLQQLTFVHRRTTAPAAQEWSVRMRMDMGAGAPVIRVGRTERCAPRPRESSQGNLLGGTGPTWADVRDSSPYSASASSLLYDENTVWIRVALDARGYVTDARVERSLVRMSEARLLSYVRSLTFFPATEDGYPVPGQLSLPLRLNRR